MRKAAHFTAALGAVFAILFLASMWVIAENPGPGATDEEIVDFYESDERRRTVLVGLYLLPLSAVSFLWFISTLREWDSASARRYNRLLGNVQLVSGIGFVTLSFAAAGASTVIAASVEFEDAPIDPEVARQFPIYGDVLLFVFAMRMAAIFVMSTTNIGRAAGVYPTWFVIVSVAVAAGLFLSATLSIWIVVIFPLWVLVLSGILFVKARPIPEEVRLPPNPGHNSRAPT